jgi:hypothetical protein
MNCFKIYLYKRNGSGLVETAAQHCCVSVLFHRMLHAIGGPRLDVTGHTQQCRKKHHQCGDINVHEQKQLHRRQTSHEDSLNTLHRHKRNRQHNIVQHKNGLISSLLF